MAPCWSTSLKTAPTEEPVALDEAKAHLSVDVSDDDGLIQSLIVAARGYAETWTNRALMTQTWYLKLDGFPCASEAVVLPRPPLSSVTAITYVDTNGVTQAWSSALYQLVKPTGPKAQYARVLPAYRQYYPITRFQPEAVTVEYVCGYASAEDVPQEIKLGLLELIEHWYRNRGAVDLISRFGNEEVPISVTALLGSYAVNRW